VARRQVAAWTAAVVLWVGLGFSLGWYYTFTYYGRAGWPMPVPEGWAAILLYYFSVLNIATEGQAVHWMIAFPAAGSLWTACLQATAPRLGLERPPWRRAALMLAVATVPLALPGPAMAWLAGQTEAGFAWDRMLAVALRRGNIRYGPWLTPVYFGLGCLCLALQWGFCRRLYGGSGRRGWGHYPLAAIVLVVAACVIGAALGLPLRLLLE
jgi:hypothetical protein